MRKRKYIVPVTDIIENRLEQVLLAGSNRLDDDFVIDFNLGTMEVGEGDDAASRLGRAWMVE